MGKSESGQLSPSAAEIYEEFYIPGVFAEWAPRVIDAAQIRRGQRVLDVSCGTGVLTQALAELAVEFVRLATGKRAIVARVRPQASGKQSYRG